MDLCDPKDFSVSEIETLIYFGLGILFTVLCFVTNFFWIKRIHCFPIRERSPYVSMMCIFFIWINTIIVPINLLVYYWVTKIYRNSFYVKFMTFMMFFTLFGIYTNYILRAMRLVYVVTTHFNCFFFDYLIKNEAYFFVINVMVAAIYGFIGIFLYDAKNTSFETMICLNDFQLCKDAKKITSWEIFQFVNQFIIQSILLILVFSLKRIKSCYNIVKEFVMMFLVIFISNLVYYLLSYLPKDIDEVLLILRLIIFVRNVLFIYFSFIHTLIISHHGRAPTPTYMLFQELRYFLYDHTCVKVFHKYIKKNYPNHVNGFLFYLDFVSQRVSGKNLFREYFSNNDQIGGIHENLYNRLKEEFDQNIELPFENLMEVRDLVYENLEGLFKNYKRTKSFRKLINVFEYHDLITERLYAYNMESFNMQI